MIIAIAGLSGSGKNTLGKKLAERLGYRLVCPTFKDLARREGVTLLEFQEKAAADHDIDRKFDDLLKEEASAGDCVVTTWLGPWMVEPDIAIWVFVEDKLRAQRLAGRDAISTEKAIEHIRVRDEDNRKRYKTVYGINIDDHSSFDIALNSGKYSPEELVDIIMGLIRVKKGDS